jgi:hypothetical protein
MKKYRVFINGNNCVLNMDGNIGIYGFYANRFVEAPDEKQAEYEALEQIKTDDNIQSTLLNKQDYPPTLFVEEIEELDSFDDSEALNKGVTWYPEDEAN